MQYYHFIPPHHKKKKKVVSHIAPRDICAVWSHDLALYHETSHVG